jgi:uncharacterized protein YndB with AHSA1/START domain
MTPLRASLVISAKPEAVWALVGDVTQHPQWSADALEIQHIDGDTFRSRANTKGRIFTATLEVLLSVPERRLEFRAIDSTGTYLHRIDLASQGGGTLVTRRVEAEQLSLKQRLVSTAALPIRIGALRRSLERLAEVAPD